MKCPACGNALKETTVAGITVDVCENGCGGIWFDAFELQKMDDAEEAAGEGLLDVPRDESVAVDRSARKKCPKCDDLIMMRHFASIKREVEVDECPGCAGFWLDFGELAKVRSNFTSQDEKSQATDKYFNEAFGEELAKMSAESEGDLKKARGFAHMFRFMCPTYYIPGKQDWAAF